MTLYHLRVPAGWIALLYAYTFLVATFTSGHRKAGHPGPLFMPSAWHEAYIVFYGAVFQSKNIGHRASGNRHPGKSLASGFRQQASGPENGQQASGNRHQALDYPIPYKKHHLVQAPLYQTAGVTP
jgi:hypothetical protein